MKKIFSAVIAAAMLLLTACGNSQSTSSAVDSAQSSVSDANVTSEAESSASSDPESSVPSAPESSDIDYSKLSEEEIYDLIDRKSVV